jgi:hypothetical protein
MSQNQGLLGVREFPVTHVQVRAANAAGSHSDQQLAVAEPWLRHSLFPQGLAWCIQHHGAH